MFNVVYFLVFVFFFRNDVREESGYLKVSCDCDNVLFLLYNSFRDGIVLVIFKIFLEFLLYYVG